MDYNNKKNTTALKVGRYKKTTYSVLEKKRQFIKTTILFYIHNFHSKFQLKNVIMRQAIIIYCTLGYPI